MKTYVKLVFRHPLHDQIKTTFSLKEKEVMTIPENYTGMYVYTLKRM